MHAIIVYCMGKKQVTIRLPSDLMEYIESKIEDHTFANYSHAMEVCVYRYKESEQNMRKN